MSQYQDTRDAIRAAIVEADPTCPAANIHDYFRDPQKTTDADVLALFMHNLTGGRAIIHGYMYERTTAPEMQADVASDGSDSVVRELQRFELFCYRSFIDDPANNRISSYDFQESLDALKHALRSNGAIQSLAALYEQHLESVIIIPIDRAKLAGRLCHFAKVTITFRHER